MQAAERLEAILSAQYEKYFEYLDILDSQYDAIQAGSSESIQVHIRLEASLRENIESLQKVITALEKMLSPEEQFSTCKNLYAEIDTVKERITQNIKRNKELLDKRMDEVQEEIQLIHKNLASRPKTVFAPQHSSVMLDIQC
ncbi:MAG: flagellar protein FlgN [Spirochaetaceae bacterium]|nr:flagellar protein FlgN [Spirochaetaceae bacterium]